MPTEPPDRDGICEGLPLGWALDRAKHVVGFACHPPAAASAPDGDALLSDATESHAAIIAPTGAGKGRSVLIPWLLSYRGSTIVVDPKGEAAYVTSRHRRSLGQRVVVFDPWHRCGCGDLAATAFNPMEILLGHSTDLGDDCMTLVELIVGEAPASSQDPFWRSLAIDLLVALIGWAWVRARVTGQQREGDGTLAAVWALLHDADLSYSLAVIVDTHGKHAALPAFVRNGLVNFLGHEAERVRTSVRSEAVSLIRIFSSARVQAATSRTTLPLEELHDGEQGVTLFIVVPPDRLESHAALVRVLLGTLLSIMASRRRRPRLPTLFLVDELGHIGAIPQLKQAVTLLRGYGVRVALFLQSMAQLKSLWPHDHDTLLENCGLWMNFGNTTHASAGRVASHLGDVSVDALFAMAAHETAIHRAGQPTTIVRRIDYLSDERFRGLYDPNPYYATAPGRLSP